MSIPKMVRFYFDDAVINTTDWGGGVPPPPPPPGPRPSLRCEMLDSQPMGGFLDCAYFYVNWTCISGSGQSHVSVFCGTKGGSPNSCDCSPECNYTQLSINAASGFYDTSMICGGSPGHAPNPNTQGVYWVCDDVNQC
jgi:hypothetical protein